MGMSKKGFGFIVGVSFGMIIKANKNRSANELDTLKNKMNPGCFTQKR